MLELKSITKDYAVAGGAVHALKGVSIKFRKNEFVSILGASGCGKTTLLNIIGGLDKYTSGDLVIEGKSTKEYKDGDWDTYRNHSIGFIFQSYHLIPHQTILQNVELALLIAGVDKEERRRRAIEALEKVGLGDKIHNRPNQLSGGQAQRVAIARALINDPEIVLADEPTGALDSKTSVQIMELLKEISRDRLIIMVTHNPELAEQYSTRIIRLRDGEVIDDTKPYDGENEIPAAVREEKEAENSAVPAESGNVKTNKGKKKKTSMSVGMAFSLSLKNLLSKRKRTAMVSVAGSIGIIGVSMVLAISSGVQSYIHSMENDMLSGYPLTISQTAVDYQSLMDFAASSNVDVDIDRLNDKVYVDSLIKTLMSMGDTMTTNEITEEYVDFVSKMPSEYYNALQYKYGFEPAHNIYTNFKLDAEDEGEWASITGIRTMYTAVLGEVGKKEGNEKYTQFASIIPTVDTFKEMPDNYEYILSQYDIVATNIDKTEKLTENELKDIFQSKDSLIMVIDEQATTDLVLGQFGYFTQEEFLAYAEKVNIESNGDGDTSELDSILQGYIDGKDFDFFLDKGEESTFKWYPNDTVYKAATPADMLFIPGTSVGDYSLADYKYLAYADDFDEDRDKSDDVDLKVKLILQKKENLSYGCLRTGLYYTKALTDHTLETGRASDVVKHINRQEGKQLNGMPFRFHYTFEGTYHDKNDKGLPLSYLFINSSGNMMTQMMNQMMGNGGDQYANMRVGAALVGGAEIPVAFNIYPLDFDSKDNVTNYLDGWNRLCEEGASYKWTAADGTQKETVLSEANIVKYTDTVGMIITMVNTMIEMVTIALVAFTALSLVVSTVMVGIITYVSVVERVKEIGILRSVGARKKDIKRLFNAETFIIGFASGLVGIIATYIISLIINIVVGVLYGIFTICALPWWQALVMVLISVALTLISGLIPAAAAAKKDPVVALRTE